GPASVTEPGAADEAAVVRLIERGLQVGQPTRPAAHRKTATPVDQRHAGRVIPPVLHAAQRVDHDIAGRTLPDVADDSTHSHSGRCRPQVPPLWATVVRWPARRSCLPL